MGFNRGNIWVANLLDGTLTELRASHGTLLGTFRSGSENPQWIAFGPGGDVWVAHLGFYGGVTVLRASDGVVENNYPFSYPGEITSDGSSVWVTLGSSVARFQLAGENFI